MIEAAKGLGVWDGSNGAWDVPRAMRLFENVQHLFEYPTTSTRRNDQISWKTVYNLYIKKGQHIDGDGGAMMWLRMPPGLVKPK